MTQEVFNTARDKIAEALNVVADGLSDEAEGDADLQTLLTLQGMLNDAIKAALSLMNDDVEAVGERLEWLEDDYGLECMCDKCVAKRVRVAN